MFIAKEMSVTGSRTIAPLNACHCSNRAQDCFSMT
ncbi:hypothetical protein T12_141 [Trichinella patagoniensis]|uniref:Uncharacterized protein n=1 Tax=Trichinella patagoniensis TaxID=990121 RepID=A0A0V0UJI2_9BILA|nr:hypothetical protein T12_141 [Trichinella patagoniensis]